MIHSIKRDLSLLICLFFSLSIFCSCGNSNSNSNNSEKWSKAAKVETKYITLEMIGVSEDENYPRSRYKWFDFKLENTSDIELNYIEWEKVIIDGETFTEKDMGKNLEPDIGPHEKTSQAGFGILKESLERAGIKIEKIKRIECYLTIAELTKDRTINNKTYTDLESPIAIFEF